jgi:hypothetical protein
MNKSILLLADAIINLFVGCILILYPLGIGKIIGIPLVKSSFYPVVLGGVIIGIGIALIIEWFRKSKRFVGLGLGGAISINLCAGLALLIFLLFGDLSIPLRGYIILWILAVIVLGISFLEYFAKPTQPK